MPVKVNQPLPVQVTHNTRELGGYATKNNGETRTHVFLRSDQLHDLTKAGEEYLANYGVTLIVDLRSTFERMLQPDHFLHWDMHEVHIPLLNRIEGTIAKDEIDGERAAIPKSLAGIYVMMVEEEKENIARVLRELIPCEGCALFHCTSGKDRTGIIAMFLLEMAGVDRETIIADYAASGKNIVAQPSLDVFINEKLPKGMVPADAQESKPEFMETLLNHLDKKYGSPISYLRDIGITDDEMNSLVTKFVAVPTN